MAKEGLIALACAAAVALAFVQAGDDRPVAVEATLAVQTAMQQARDFQRKGDTRSAVAVLERNLPLINGNTTYLNLLREMYRLYVLDLRAGGQAADADRYQERLKILDPTAVAAAPAATLPAVKTASAPKPAVARGVAAEEPDERDPFLDIAPDDRQAIASSDGPGRNTVRGRPLRRGGATLHQRPRRRPPRSHAPRRSAGPIANCIRSSSS